MLANQKATSEELSWLPLSSVLGFEDRRRSRGSPVIVVEAIQDREC